MADKTGIEWTDATWNPTTGCDRVSPGCAHCYALDMAGRLKAAGAAAYRRDGDPKTSGPGFAFTEHPDRLAVPLRWRQPKRIFVNSMSDLFHEQATDEFLDRVFAVMAATPRHTFQVLTKRPERMRDYFARTASGAQREQLVYDAYGRTHLRAPGVTSSRWPGWPLPNVWLAVSVENQRWTSRIAPLLETPAAVRFLSCEPLLGPIDLRRLNRAGACFDTLTGNVTDRSTGGLVGIYPRHIDWVIVGGESGPAHRPVDPEWVRSLRDQCQAAGVAFLFKQWGGRTPKAGGRELDGRTWDEYPVVAGG